MCNENNEAGRTKNVGSETCKRQPGFFFFLITGSLQSWGDSTSPIFPR